MRPKTLDEVIGQALFYHLYCQLFNNLMKVIKVMFRQLFYFIRQVSKTTLAYLIASNKSRDFIELSAASTGVSKFIQLLRLSVNLLEDNVQQCFLLMKLTLFQISNKMHCYSGS